MTKKDSILTAALKLLALNGVHATPMSSVAKEAGTGMGTIYNYFPNKEVLINALYIKIKEDELSVFDAFDKKRSLKKQFERYYVQGIQFYLENPLFFKFIEQLQASPIITDESKETGYRAVEAVLNLIENGKQVGKIKDIPTHDILQFIGGTVISYLRLYFQNNKSSKPSLDNHLGMVWDAIKS